MFPQTTFTKSLAEILSRDTSFYDIVLTERLFQNHFPNPNIYTWAFIPTLTLTPTQIPTLTQAVENEVLVSLAGHVTKTVFTQK